MQGSSRESLAAARERLDQQLAAAGPGEPGAEPAGLAEDLFAVVRLLDNQIVLRRALTDPAASAERKAGLVRSLLEGKVGPAAVAVTADLAGARWSSARDLSDAVEALAVHSAVTAAERQGHLDDVEDELFRFGRIVAANPALRGVLADRTVAAERKAALVRGLLGDRVKPVTLRLVEQSVSQPRGRTLESALDEYARLAAAQRQRLVALVRVAVPLTDATRDRLAAALHRLYGREAQLNVELDPQVVGGISVHIGHEVIDGTAASRLEEAGRQLAG